MFNIFKKQKPLHKNEDLNDLDVPCPSDGLKNDADLKSICLFNKTIKFLFLFDNINM